MTSRFALLLLSLLLLSATDVRADNLNRNITFANYCNQTIWLGQDGSLMDEWEMPPDTTVIKAIPLHFSGRWWPRTGDANLTNQQANALR